MNSRGEIGVGRRVRRDVLVEVESAPSVTVSNNCTIHIGYFLSAGQNVGVAGYAEDFVLCYRENRHVIWCS